MNQSALCASPDICRCCVEISGLCDVATFFAQYHAPKEVAPKKVSGPVKAKTTNWKRS